MIGIYKIINTENGKIYIGQSINISHRWNCHKYDLKNKRHKNLHLQRGGRDDATSKPSMNINNCIISLSA